ncbi:MAG TPA: lytic transglycosylase domain-containing protein [Polyangiales bacterium]
MRIKLRSQALAGLALWLFPQLARGWADGPFCDFPRQSSDEVGAFDEEALGMCAAPLVSAPHLLRNPGFEACLSNSGRAATDEEAAEIDGNALKRSRELMLESRYEEALLNLRVVEAQLPRIADHVAFMRGELHEKNLDPVRAALAYGEAIELSPDIELRAKARVGYVRALLRAGAPNAEAELQSLQIRYPQLPEAPQLKLELARHREITGQIKGAIAIYRAIDLANPGYPMATEARERLAYLAGIGHVVAPYTDLETLQRTERLIRSGPLEQARATVMELRSRKFSPGFVWQRDQLLTRFDELEAKRFAKTTEKPAEVITADPAFELFKKRLLAPGGDKVLAKTGAPLLYLYLRKASAGQMTELADQLVNELTLRVKSSSPELRFEALVTAAGTASDGALVALADTLLASPKVAIAARYHRARALERMGSWEEARVELTRVMELDVMAPRFYGIWAEQRIRELDQPVSCRSPGRADDCNRLSVEAALAACEAAATVDRDKALSALKPLEATYRDAYPWLSRAQDLLRIGELDRASDELHEAYLAWRFVSRRGPLRAGREAVYRGQSVVRAPSDMNTLRARLALGPEARTQLADVAAAIGDWGTAVDFGGVAYAEQNAHPYAAEIAQAARRYGLDPDLLFAVMRVESVYQRRIISHAGAIGLMQIMPRTGRLIADKLGLRDMTTTDLLDPRTNIELSAWYFSSLLQRMEGRLPLAIAGYNGGPHNVRAWIRSYGAHVPLDAFLERIPFTETKRYVRRVLGYYTSYKAKRGQQVDLMAVHLPGDDRPSVVSF